MSSCDWGFRFEAMKTYHDTEWGISLHNDQKQFEFLMMEDMQCGLSWDLMIKKREIFRKYFDGFYYDKIVEYTEADVEYLSIRTLQRLAKGMGMILKIEFTLEQVSVVK